MRRVPLLAALILSIVIAGCSATTGIGPTATPTKATPMTSSPIRCTADRQHVVDPMRDSVEPSEYPEPPDQWTASSVEAYVVGVEKAYSRNDALRRESTRVEVAVSGVSVTREGDTWFVELTSRTNTWAAGTATGSATPTVIHGDGALVPVVYRLTGRALYRTEGAVTATPSTTPAPTTPAGPPLVCFDG